MKELGRGAMPPRIFGLEPVNNIGQLPCASASVLRYTASVLASVSEATALVTTLHVILFIYLELRHLEPEV